MEDPCGGGREVSGTAVLSGQDGQWSSDVSKQETPTGSPYGPTASVREKPYTASGQSMPCAGLQGGWITSGPVSLRDRTEDPSAACFI